MNTSSNKTGDTDKAVSDVDQVKKDKERSRIKIAALEQGIKLIKEVLDDIHEPKHPDKQKRLNACARLCYRMAAKCNKEKIAEKNIQEKLIKIIATVTKVLKDAGWQTGHLEGSIAEILAYRNDLNAAENVIERIENQHLKTIALTRILPYQIKYTRDLGRINNYIENMTTEFEVLCSSDKYNISDKDKNELETLLINAINRGAQMDPQFNKALNELKQSHNESKANAGDNIDGDTNTNQVDEKIVAKMETIRNTYREIIKATRDNLNQQKKIDSTPLAQAATLIEVIEQKF